MGEFIKALGAHVPDALYRPFDFFVLTGSPLHLLTQQRVWPGRHLAALLTALGFLVLIWLIGKVLWRWLQDSRSQQHGTALVVLMIFGLAHYWILAYS